MSGAGIRLTKQGVLGNIEFAESFENPTWAEEMVPILGYQLLGLQRMAEASEKLVDVLRSRGHVSKGRAGCAVCMALTDYEEASK